mmetsp:Transcript_37361/g.116811  ORF Transcript_37361/g.116811 Transcript_37361/m.116811 type:complete len:207 (+) Transcript_37361:995-1615(+)
MPRRSDRPATSRRRQPRRRWLRLGCARSRRSRTRRASASRVPRRPLSFGSGQGYVLSCQKGSGSHTKLTNPRHSAMKSAQSCLQNAVRSAASIGGVPGEHSSSSHQSKSAARSTLAISALSALLTVSGPPNLSSSQSAELRHMRSKHASRYTMSYAAYRRRFFWRGRRCQMSGSRLYSGFTSSLCGLVHASSAIQVRSTSLRPRTA